MARISSAALFAPTRNDWFQEQRDEGSAIHRRLSGKALEDGHFWVMTQG
jgi:hypothetical protein